MGFFEYASKFKVAKDDGPVAKFSEQLRNQRKGFEKSEFNRRSWIKEDAQGFVAKLGKLPESYRLTSREEVIEFLDNLEQALGQDEELRNTIEEAYSKAPKEQPVKTKRKYTRKSAEG